MATPADGPSLSPRAEIQRLREEAVRQKDLAHRRANFWAVADIALGMPAALLASISGVAGLSSAGARVPAAVVTLVAAGLVACATFLRSDHRCLANKRARRAWAVVEAKASVKLTQEHVTSTDLDELFVYRHEALAAYEADEPPPSRLPEPRQ